MLDPQHRQRLLRIARESIASALDGRTLELTESEVEEPLRRPAGAFVTLRDRGGMLRGCIGSIVPVAPLFRAVSTSAVNAAFRDPRFHPVRREELPHLHLEISVMGPIERVKEPEEVIVGRDGLIVTLGRNIGLLLPQVASEQGWDGETFLGQTCVKAGLPAESWRSPACRLERFSAEVFGELND